MKNILTTHVGSPPRTQDVVDFIFAREHGKEYATADFNTCMTSACSETVRKQVAAGIDIVSDGATSKISYATYVKDSYTGFPGDSPRNPPADLKQFPGYLKRLADEGGTPQYARPICTGDVRSKGQGELEKDIANLKSAVVIRAKNLRRSNWRASRRSKRWRPESYARSRAMKWRQTICMTRHFDRLF